MRHLIDQGVIQKEIPIQSIIVKNTARVDSGNIQELALSIKEKGLIHPIAVMETEEPEKYRLIAGSRRLKAMVFLERETIPARIYHKDLSTFEFRSIELEENLKRKDMTDVERLLAQKNLHDLWIKEYGEKTSTSATATGHSAADTAQRLGISKSKVSQDLEVAEWLEIMPELGKLGSRSEIRKAINLAKRQAALTVAAEKYESSPDEPNPEATSLLDSFIIGDFFEKVKDIPDGSINLIDLDIDYPIEETDQMVLSNFDKGAKNYFKISKADFPNLMQRALKECYRVSADNSWILIWFGYEYFSQIQDWASQAGYRTSYTHAIWYKGEKRGHSNNPDVTLNHTREPFFYFKKGSPKLTAPADDVFLFPPIASVQKNHPYEKPLGLMENIIGTFALKKSRVLVPFAGSGNTLLAAKKLGMFPIGFDLSTYYWNQFAYTVRSLFK